MSHDPKLTVYTIKIKPTSKKNENSNRSLFKHIIGEASSANLSDSYILTELFKRFIAALDRPEMYSDDKSKKCMTANQLDVENASVNANILLHSDQQIFEGRVEGGSYGRKRSKTSIDNKLNKSGVSEMDAITDNFYFLIYLPLASNKIVLMFQSYSDDNIDSVMRHFLYNFLRFEGAYKKPTINRFVPKAIIDDFKQNSSVSSLTFSTEVPSDTLLSNTVNQQRRYNIIVSIKPLGGALPVDEFESTLPPIQNNSIFNMLTLGAFSRRRGMLKDNVTNKTSPFDLGSSFDVRPIILLSKYIVINGDESDFDRIKQYCFELLEEIKGQIYPSYAVQER